ncbi:hypothetical protein [Enterococcus casseliflavus]|uniref:hypothetical protein n=1 Tax=Enterococcus casseliflavus TaxID=37734 RepID=UPI0022E80141|nr:hypothetical protein [Enterococcus casseliflavus]
MNYNWVYYGRKVRRFLLFAIKFIDVFLLYLVIGRQTYLSIKIFLLILILWIIGSAVALIRRKIKYGTINDRPKEDGYLHPIHDRRENIMLLVCVVLLIMQLYILSLPLPTI